MSSAGWLALAGMLALAHGSSRGTPARHREPGARGAGLVPRPTGTGLPPVAVAVAVAASAVLAGVMVGGWPGIAAAPLAAGAAWLVLQLPRVKAGVRPPEPRSVAFVVDLLAGALAAGLPPELAIEGIAAAVTEHGSDTLRRAVEPLGRVGRLLQLGSEPAAAWATLYPVPGYAPVADSGRRCATSGARLASALAGVADDLRARRQTEALARAERVGVWSLLPLGLCFLPAFVCLGVIPVILGVAGEVFGGLSR